MSDLPFSNEINFTVDDLNMIDEFDLGKFVQDEGGVFDSVYSIAESENSFTLTYSV